MDRALSKLPEPDPRERALAKTLGIPDLLARVLLARGIDDPDRVRAFLRPDLRALHDPFTFTDMKKAVDRIRTAIRAGEKILIHGDYDVDGISGTVLLHRFFKLMHANARPFIPARADGYSFSAASERAILDGGYRLVISVDNGTNAVEPISRLQQAGVDVIVTDHHGTTENTAPAFALLNPRLPGAGYPDRNLAGVGVAFRLATAIASSFSRDLLQSPEFADFLADAMTWVTLGTIADVAPLCGENRILVFHGLRALAQSKSPGIRALLDSAGLLNRSPDVEDIAFRIAPLINAAGRMGQGSEAVELLCAPGYSEAQTAAKVLEKHNEERRRVERRLQETVLAQSANVQEAAIVLAGDDWHPGVLGIVAARIAETTGKPTILVAFQGDVGRGSGRTTNGVHLCEALSACSEHLVAHGGHAAAAGLEVRRDRFDAFRTRFAEACATMLRKAPTVAIDGRARFGELDPQTIRKLDLLGPFGMGHRRPRFCTQEVTLVGQPATDTRGQDLRLRVVRDGQILPAKVLRASHRFEEVRERKGPWTLVYTPRLNPRGEEGPVWLEVHELHAG
ncbi:MAG: single-stranded-DNA-specific exonuclease RecJ [Planctomycetes bacterium]|nr:single-stranded-DNA-specific exonuclease RecJ [Planctomycetota bacterium]